MAPNAATWLPDARMKFCRRGLEESSWHDDQYILEQSSYMALNQVGG
jgi:hypothetical protein